MKIIREEGLTESEKQRLLTEREVVRTLKIPTLLPPMDDSTVFIMDIHMKDMGAYVKETGPLSVGDAKTQVFLWLSYFLDYPNSIFN